MWPFNRKSSTQLSIIDIARNKMIAERDQHETAMRHYETIVNDATANMQHHEAAYLAYDAILQRIEPHEQVIDMPDFTDAEFEAALTDTTLDGFGSTNMDAAKIDILENLSNASKNLGAISDPNAEAKFLEDLARRKAGTERKSKRTSYASKLPKADGAAGAC